MRRAPSGLSLLLMAALAFAAPPLEIINPWLSACDLQPGSATDLKGACPTMWGPGPHCPPPCSSNSTTQCLVYLEESHKEELCGLKLDPEGRREALKKLRMPHCCDHEVITALPETVLQGGKNCSRLLDALLKVDKLSAQISCEFAEVLYRYDCSQKYSIQHQCEDCKKAYQQWVCSSMVPHITEKGRVRPCLNVCQTVEQKCPYMLPADRAPAYPTQYAGEPTFLCLDPNIPETGDQRKKSSVGDEDCCYSHCGAPGRGLSVNCPGSTSNDSDLEIVQCVGNGTGLPSCRLSASSSASRTLNKVLPLWTAWIILIKINTISNILKCLLVLCATSVRTSLTRIKTKWRQTVVIVLGKLGDMCSVHYVNSDQSEITYLLNFYVKTKRNHFSRRKYWTYSWSDVFLIDRNYK